MHTQHGLGKKEELGNIIKSIADFHLQTYKSKVDELYETAKIGFLSAKEGSVLPKLWLKYNKRDDDLVTPLLVSFNPVDSFRKTSVSPLSSDQKQIFSNLSKVFYGNTDLLETTGIDIVKLTRELRDNALRQGSKEYSQVNSKFIEDNYLEPYIEKAYSNNTVQEVKDYLFKLEDGSYLTGKQKYEKMIKFLVDQPVRKDHPASDYIPMDIPVQVLLDIQKALTSKKFNSQVQEKIISSSGKISENQQLQEIQTTIASLTSDINSIDSAINEAIETSSDALKGQYRKAFNQYKEAKKYFSETNNHYKGGAVHINVGNQSVTLDATGSPLNMLHNNIKTDKAKTGPFENYLHVFINPENPEYRLARHQFDMFAKKDDGTYDEDIVERMVQSLGYYPVGSSLEKKAVLQNFTTWFDNVIEFASVSDKGKRIKHHYEAWKKTQYSDIKTIESFNAVQYTEQEIKIAETFVDYLRNIEDTTKTLFDKSPIGVITQKMETLKMYEIAELLTEKVSIATIKNNIDQYPVLSKILDERRLRYRNLDLNVELKKIDKEIGPVSDAEIERIAKQFEISEDSVTRLDVLIKEMNEALDSRKISFERHEEMMEFMKKIMMTKLFKESVIKMPRGTLIDGLEQHGDFGLFRKEYYEYRLDTNEKESAANFIKWLEEEKNIPKEKLGSIYKLDGNIDLVNYKNFIEENDHILTKLWPDTNEGRNPHLQILDEVFNVKNTLDTGKDDMVQIAGTSSGNFTEQMAAGRLYNAMKGVVSYRYLIMEAGFMKATAAQQGVLSSILRDKEMAKSVHTLFEQGIFDDKSFEIIWSKLLANLARVGIMQTITKEEFKERVTEQQALLHEDRYSAKLIRQQVA